MTQENSILTEQLRKNEPDNLKRLIEAKADPDCQKFNGETCLKMAISRKSATAGEQLFEAQKKSILSAKLIEAVRKNDPDNIKQLIKAKANPNYEEPPGETPLRMAITINSATIVEQLLEAKADVNHRYTSQGPLLGQTPLIFAANCGYTIIMENLLKAGAIITSVDELGRDATTIAAARNQAEALRMLIQAKADVNQKYRHDHTALHIATHQSAPDSMRVLLEAKAEVDAANEEKQTPLMLAAKNSNPGLTTILLRANANIEAQSSNGQTAISIARSFNNTAVLNKLIGYLVPTAVPNFRGLHEEKEKAKEKPTAASARQIELDNLLIRAIYNKNSSVAEELLLKDKASPDSQEKDSPPKGSNTALGVAVTTDQPKIVELLLKAQATVNHAQIDQHSPLTLAAMHGSTTLVNRLLKAKANVNHAQNHGRTALMLSAAAGHQKTTALLIAEKADLKQTDEGGNTALHIAVSSNTPECMRQLLKAKAEVNTKTKLGDTPLILAATQTNPALTTMLLEAKADANAQNLKNGLTALARSILHDNTAIEELLRSHLEALAREKVVAHDAPIASESHSDETDTAAPTSATPSTQAKKAYREQKAKPEKTFPPNRKGKFTAPISPPSTSAMDTSSASATSSAAAAASSTSSAPSLAAPIICDSTTTPKVLRQDAARADSKTEIAPHATKEHQPSSRRPRKEERKASSTPPSGVIERQNKPAIDNSASQHGSISASQNTGAAAVKDAQRAKPIQTPPAVPLPPPPPPRASDWLSGRHLHSFSSQVDPKKTLLANVQASLLTASTSSPHLSQLESTTEFPSDKKDDKTLALIPQRKDNYSNIMTVLGNTPTTASTTLPPLPIEPAPAFTSVPPLVRSAPVSAPIPAPIPASIYAAPPPRVFSGGHYTAADYRPPNPAPVATPITRAPLEPPSPSILFPVRVDPRYAQYPYLLSLSFTESGLVATTKPMGLPIAFS